MTIAVFAFVGGFLGAFAILLANAILVRERQKRGLAYFATNPRRPGEAKRDYARRIGGGSW